VIVWEGWGVWVGGFFFFFVLCLSVFFFFFFFLFFFLLFFSNFFFFFGPFSISIVSACTDRRSIIFRRQHRSIANDCAAHTWLETQFDKFGATTSFHVPVFHYANPGQTDHPKPPGNSHRQIDCTRRQEKVPRDVRRGLVRFSKTYIIRLDVATMGRYCYRTSPLAICRNIVKNGQRKDALLVGDRYTLIGRCLICGGKRVAA